MNARQKAKKLKKELDYIKSQPFRNVYKVINVELEHLRAYRVFPLEEVERFGEEVIEDEAKHQLSIDFLKYIRENMIVNKDSDIDRLRNVRYSTDIWVSFGRR